MSADPNEPVVLGKVKSEAQAALAVNALAERGITAHSAGELTSGFRAEAPGEVKVLVHLSDLENAKKAWAEIEADLNRMHSEDEDSE